MEDTNGRSDRVRVVVVEGVELVRRGICGVLAQHGAPLELAAEISQSNALPETCKLLTPDVIVLSLRSDGEQRRHLGYLRQALEVRPAARTVVLLEQEGSDDVIGAVRAGASGVLLRDSSAGTLLAAIEDVLTGGATLDPRLARGLFNRLAAGDGLVRQGPTEPQVDPVVAGSLSRREQEVLRALARGCRNKEISRQLGVSVGTVKTHLRHIFRKLHVDDRTAAVLIALQGNLPKAA